MPIANLPVCARPNCGRWPNPAGTVTLGFVIQIRSERPADAGAIAEVVRRAFGQEDEATLVARLRSRGGFDERLSVVAEAEGRLVGHVLFTPIAVKDDMRETPALALAPLAVDPAHQRKGIGAALVREGLAICNSLGHELVIVVGEGAYYTRFGFQPAGAWGIVAPFAVPAEAWMVLALRIGALDGVRGVVAYPEPFHEVKSS